MKFTSKSAKEYWPGFSQMPGSTLMQALFTVLALTSIFMLSGIQAQAQYVVGTSAIAANSLTVDTYSATELDPIANYYYDAYVEGYLYKRPSTSLIWQLIRSGSAFSGSESNVADGYITVPTETRNSYQIESDHFVVAYYYYSVGAYYNPYGWGFASQDDPWWPSGYQFLPGSWPPWVSIQYIYLGTTGVGVSTNTPSIEGIQPSGAVRGNNGYIALYGSNMLGTTQAQLSGSGASVTPVYVGPNQVNLQFSTALTAATGLRGLTLTNQFGTSNSEDFIIGDPTPNITGINPSSWEVGTQTEVVITGTGFGTRPAVNVTGGGISITILNSSDTEIRCRFTIDNSAADGTRTVTVISNGYGSNPFISAPIHMPNEFPPSSQSVPTSNGVPFSVTTPTVTFQQFNSILVGGTRRVNVNVSSMVPGRQVNINIRAVSGGATFASNNSTVISVGTGNTTLAIRGNNLSQSVDGLSLTAEFGSRRFEEKFTVAFLYLKEVSYSGPGMHTIFKDDGSGDYAAPHWVDNSTIPNGTADDPGDRTYPVLYVRNNRITVSLRFVTYPSVSIDGQTVRIKGDGPGDCDFAENAVTSTTSELVISNYVSTGNIAATVTYFNPMFIFWSYQPPEASGSWWSSGTSKNQTYVTLNTPMTVSLPFHTIIHLACVETTGQDTPNGVFDRIWRLFAEKRLYTADGTKQLKYYNPKDTYLIAPSGLIFTGNGQCGSFSRLLIDALRAHGITSTKFVGVDRTDTTLMSRGIFIKNWTFTAAPGKSGDSEYPYLNVILDQVSIEIPSKYFSSVHNYSYKEISDSDGIEGQGSPDPSSIFHNHQFVEYNNTWYDPSYGVIYPGLDVSQKLLSVQGAIDGLYELRRMTVSEAVIDRDLNGNGTKTDVIPDLWCLISKKKPSTPFLINSLIPYPSI